MNINIHTDDAGFVDYVHINGIKFVPETVQVTPTRPSAHYTVYTDGACRNNPGRGGWGYIIISDDGHTTENSAGFKHTTNNRMEIMAVIQALKALPEDALIDLYSDSNYVVKSFTEYLKNWTSDGIHFKSSVKNIDLWQEAWALTRKRNINWHWVKGHADNPYNQRADELATSAADNINDLLDDVCYE